MKAQIGCIASLYYDSPRDVEPGHVLKTMTGRCYEIVDARRQARGLHIGRWHLKALVIDQPRDGATVHPIYWYRRKKRRMHVGS